MIGMFKFFAVAFAAAAFSTGAMAGGGMCGGISHEAAAPTETVSTQDATITVADSETVSTE